MLPVADGSDFMGSLRNPAGWNDVYGFRPSQGRVPRWPSADVGVALLSTEGPMGRNVRDVAALLDVQAGWDPRVPLAIATKEAYARDLDAFDPHGVRVGWLGDLGGYLPMEDGIVEICERGLKRVATLGGTVEPTPLGFAPERVWDAWLVWRRWSVAARIAPHLADPENRARIKPEALWEYDQGQGLTGMQTVQACADRTAFHSHMVRLFERYDALALPTAQVWPFPAEWRWPQSIAGRTMDTYHRWMEVVIYATLAGLPCIAMPVGFGAAGLPMGVQLIGRPHGDLALLQFAHAFEQAAHDARPASRQVALVPAATAGWPLASARPRRRRREVVISGRNAEACAQRTEELGSAAHGVLPTSRSLPTSIASSRRPPRSAAAASTCCSRTPARRCSGRCLNHRCAVGQRDGCQPEGVYFTVQRGCR